MGTVYAARCLLLRSTPTYSIVSAKRRTRYKMLGLGGDVVYSLAESLATVADHENRIICRPARCRYETEPWTRLLSGLRQMRLNDR